MGLPVLMGSGVTIRDCELKRVHASHAEPIKAHDAIGICGTTHVGGWQTQTPPLLVMTVVVASVNQRTDELDSGRQLNGDDLIGTSLFAEVLGQGVRHFELIPSAPLHSTGIDTKRGCPRLEHSCPTRH